MRHCYYCMKPLEKGSYCPHCGKDEKDYKENIRHIKPGTVLEGKYLIGHVLGEGGFGITYVALDINLNLKVAIKEYFPASLASRDVYSITGDALQIMGGESAIRFRTYKDRYEKEGNMLARLDDCPGIVKVLNFFSANNTAYMVMEYLDNTLEKYRKSMGGTLDQDTVKKLFKPVLESMIKVHELGIIHKDISPDNIMMTSDNKIKIIDFGASEDQSDSPDGKLVVLKRYYAPPEQYQSGSVLGPQADVYALCATMYVCLTGKKMKESIDRYFEKDESDIENLEGIADEKFIAALRYGLKPDLDSRCSSVAELCDCIYGEKVIVDETPVVEVEEKSSKGLQIAFIALFAIAILGIGIFFGPKIKSIIAIQNGVISQEEIAEQADAKTPNTGIGKGDIDETETATSGEVSEIEDTSQVATVDSEKDYEPEIIANNIEYLQYEDYTDASGKQGIKVTSFDSAGRDSGQKSSVDGVSVDVVVPTQIDGKDVLSVSGLNSSITSAYISEGVERIDNNAFKNYYYLERIYLPKSLKEIGHSAFDNCMGLKEIYIDGQKYTYDFETKEIVDEEGSIFLKVE